MLQKENFRLENIGRKTIESYIIIRCLMVIFKEKFKKIVFTEAVKLR